MTFERRFDMCTTPGLPPASLYLSYLSLWVRGLDNRRLALIAADCRFRYFDIDLVGHLKLHALLVEAHDLAEDPARGDDLVVDLQVVEKFLHLLLLALAGEQDDEIEDCQNQDEGDDLQQRASALEGHAHGEHGIGVEDHHQSWGWRDKL